MSGASPDLEAGAELLKALAHPVRLAILRTIAEGERTVGGIEQASGIAQPGLSQQLAVLRNAELVVTRRAAKQVFYRINQPRMAEVSRLIDAFAGPVVVTPPKTDPIAGLRAGSSAAMFARVG